MPRKRACEAERILAWLEAGGFDLIVQQHETDGTWSYFEGGFGWHHCNWGDEPATRSMREAIRAAMAAPGNNR